MKHGRRVLAAWVVGGQLLTLPCVGLATMMGALGVRPETDLATRVVFYSLPLLVEGTVAFTVALALRARLRGRVSYSALVVALASCAGMVVALVVALAVAYASLWAGHRLVPGFESDTFEIVAACVTGVLLLTGSAAGVMLATRGVE